MTDIINLNDNLPLPPQPASSSPALTATLVQDEQRISFWPQHFGSIPQWITLEPFIDILSHERNTANSSSSRAPSNSGT